MNKIEVYIDGVCEPFNPGGTAAYGLLVKQDEKILISEGKIVGSGPKFSNNVAEYSGLIAFLEWYQNHYGELGDHDITVYSDSKLLIFQMSGQWRVKRGLYVPYHQKARQMIGMTPIYFKWIPREENAEADKLSKRPLIDKGIKFRIQLEG